MDSKSKKPSFMDIMAITVLILSFVYFFVVYFFKNPIADSNFTTQIVTAVIAMDMLVLSFYYGSTKASANKDATILEQAQANNQQTVKAEVVNTENIETVNTSQVNEKEK